MCVSIRQEGKKRGKNKRDREGMKEIEREIIMTKRRGDNNKKEDMHKILAHSRLAQTVL